MLIFKFFTNKKFNQKYMYVISCVLSYLLISLIEFVKTKNNLGENEILNNTLCVSFIAMLIGSVFSFLVAVISDAKLFSDVMVRCFHRTPKDNIWEDVIDFNNGSKINIFLKDEDFYLYGVFRYIEENKEDPYIAISGARTVDLESDEIINRLNDDDFTVVRLSDARYIEVNNQKIKISGKK